MRRDPMRHRGSYVACCLAAVVAGARPAEATLVRTEVIGQTVLLPDAEQDLREVPAFIHALDGSRLFGRLGLILARSENDTGLTSGKTSEFSFDPAAEYVKADGAWPLAIRYNPIYFDLHE